MPYARYRRPETSCFLPSKSAVCRDSACLIDQNPDRARIYRQHIVDLLNTSRQANDITIDDSISQEQERFIGGDIPVPDLIVQARLYALGWTSIQVMTDESQLDAE